MGLVLPFGFLLWHRADVALAAAIALFAACSTATMVAMVLPWAVPPRHRPRLRERPLATVVQDLLSLPIYFLVAAALVR